MNTDKIRNRKSYKEFKELVETMGKSKEDVLNKVYEMLDSKKAFGSRKNAQFVRESIDLIIEELEEEQFRANVYSMDDRELHYFITGYDLEMYNKVFDRDDAERQAIELMKGEDSKSKRAVIMLTDDDLGLYAIYDIDKDEFVEKGYHISLEAEEDAKEMGYTIVDED